MGELFYSACRLRLFRSSRGGSPFLKDEKRGKRIFLRGRLPYARENKITTIRLPLSEMQNSLCSFCYFLCVRQESKKPKAFASLAFTPLLVRVHTRLVARGVR